MIRTHSIPRERWGENRPPKGKGGPRFGSVDKGWCCHERGLNDSGSCLSTKLRLFPVHRGGGGRRSTRIGGRLSKMD